MFIFNNFWVLTFFATLTFILSVSAETCKPQINRVFDLRKTLFCNYDTSLIAKRDKNKNATKINVGFTFNYFDFNQWDNTVTIAHWLVLRWTDDHLTWNPDLFDGIKEINVNVDELWMPDLTIYNPSGMYNSEITHPSINCDLQHTGFIVCVIPNSYYTLCKSNHLNFPYDEHECTLRFGSLLYTKKNVEFKIPKMQGYLGTLNNKNLEWKVINATGKIKERHIDVNDTMQEIAYTFRFARHATVLEATLIVPMLVLILFTILPFFLSPIENERFTLIIFNIFAHITIFYQIPWTIPHSGDTTPLIVSFYRDSLIISILVLFESAIVCWFDKKSTQIPDSLAPLFQIILQHKNWILLTVPGEKHVESEEESENVTSNGVDESDLKTESLDGPIHVTIPIKPSSGAQDWHILRLFLDRLFICIILFLYIILFITHVPSLVLTLPQHKHELSTTKFYLVLQALNGDHSGRASYGMVFFRQDQLHIDLFVFFSVFFSCFFLFLAACVVAWKAKQAADIRRARRRHVVEMLHMAKRPFASVSLIIGPRTPVALRRLKSRGRASYTTVGDVRPVAIEPTEDNVAAVATVFIKLPGGRQAPVRLALASSLILLARQFPPGGRAFLRRRSAQQALPPS